MAQNTTHSAVRERQAQNDLSAWPADEVRIVGIGASAGGLEALENFFDHIPSDCGVAFVIVQHLSPHHKSFMAELLGRHTKMMIRLAEDGMKIEPNRIYLIPPTKYMTVSNGCLHLTDYPAERSGVQQPIDEFLFSLAASLGPASVAIILSGTGTDGTRGIRAIHEAGGLVMVQDEETAKFYGMPQSAIESGVVDIVLGPEEMANHLFALFKGEPKANDEEELMTAIFALLRERHGVDYSGYKRDGVMRRVERRLKLRRIDTLEEYVRFLLQNPDEVSSLQKDMLIGVTNFFRDKGAFAAIEQKVIPAIIAAKRKAKEREIRIWVTACSTGEEAYTFAMLFRKYIEDHALDLNVRLFATDLDSDSIQYAGQGQYPLSLAQEIDRDYVDRFFERRGEAYVVKKEIRQMVVFAPHNIIKDPPFINMDLISCRNMMIYFQPEVQRKVLSLFHFSMSQDGYLFLGSSESVGKLHHLFEPFDARWNIFRCTNQPPNRLSGAMEVFGRRQEAAAARPLRSQSLAPAYVGGRKLDDVYALLIETCMPPSILIDGNNDVVHTFGDLSPYLVFPRGKLSFNVHRMVSTQLSVVISTGVHKVRKERVPVVYKNIQIRHEDSEQSIDLTLKPFPDSKQEELILILFDKPQELQLAQAAQAEYVDIGTHADLRIQELERDLRYARESLQATVEELETSNEELQATNEELIASNEELQSTNEELQSVNEELIAVNEEHQRKIEALTELNNDMDNFLISTKIGTIFLDHDLCIRRFTPAVTSIIHLMDIDIGRPLHHLSHQLKYDRLLEDAASVLRSVTPIEKEIQSRDGRWYNLNILPYRTVDNQIKGVVLTFVDITELKSANEALMKLSYALEQSPSHVLIAGVDGITEYVNNKFTEVSGYEASDLVGQPLSSLHEEQTVPFEVIWKALRSGQGWNGELEGRRRNGDRYWEEAVFLPLHSVSGEAVHYLKVGQDITEKKNTEELLRKSEMHSAVGQLAAGIAHEIRNPLTALKGFLQLLQVDGEKNETYVKIMLSEFERIETIINELLMISKPHELNFHRADLFTILNDVLLLLETQAIMNKITIEADLKADLPVIECVENQIKQVFINILKNAIEAMMVKGGTVIVSVRIVEGQGVLVSFTDQGGGISEDHIRRVGEPFYTTKEKGTGLGLMVSKKIIENHGGQLNISSQPDAGTTVEILLPTL